MTRMIQNLQHLRNLQYRKQLIIGLLKFRTMVISHEKWT